MNEKRVPFAVSFVAGGVSGTVGAVLTCPLEVVKTRLQSSMYTAPSTGINGSALAGDTIVAAKRGIIRTVAFHIRGTFAAVHQIYAVEGLAALWKGVGATVVGVMPSRAIYFSTYAKSKHLLIDWNGGREGPAVHLLSAASAGIATATATNPIWLIKTRMQLQQTNANNARYKSSLDCLMRVVKEEGVRGLYKGLSASYLGVAEGTIQWVLYERLKRHLNQNNSNKNNQWGSYFVAAAGSKLFAATLTYPHEVLRTRLREQSCSVSPKYRGLVQAARLIVKEEGFAALYGGMTAHMMRVVPNSAIMFFCYEFLTHLYAKSKALETK